MDNLLLVQIGDGRNELREQSLGITILEIAMGQYVVKKLAA